MMLAAFFEAVKKIGQPACGTDNDDTRTRLVYINPFLITTPCFHPRRNFDTAAMLELCASISCFGIINPITVRISDDGRYETVCGARRLRAAKMLSLERVPCVVISADEKNARELAIHENGFNTSLFEMQEGDTSTAKSDNIRHSIADGNSIYNKRKETCGNICENTLPEKQNIKISLKDGRIILNSVNRLAKLAQNCGAQTSVEISPQSVEENTGNFETVCLKISFPVQKMPKKSDDK